MGTIHAIQQLKREKRGHGMQSVSTSEGLMALASAGCKGHSEQKHSAGTISLCLIVRNEQELLPRCLSSAQGVVDEMIVVDTGSTDNTIKIAETYGAQIYHYVWSDDFAAARNVSLAQASCEWILVLDADEVLTESFCSNIKSFLQDSNCIAYQCVIEDHYDSEVVLEPVFRLFRNLEGIHYRRPYHEYLNLTPIAKGLPCTEAKTAEALTIFHDGYKQQRVQHKGKLERSLRIMGQYLEEQPEDAYLRAKLASSWLMAGDQQKAQDHAQLALAMLEKTSERFIYETYDIAFNCALVFAQCHQWEMTCTALEIAVCTSIPNAHKQQAIVLLAQVYAQLRRYEQALRITELALPEFPTNSNLLIAHGWSLFKSKQTISEAVLFLEQAVTLSPNSDSAWNCLGAVYFSQEQFDQAITALQRATVLVPNNPDYQFDLGLTCFEIGQLQLAQTSFIQALEGYPVDSNRAAECASYLEQLEFLRFWQES
jgi:tetratricopeptide (TPR) repeat protein